MVRESIAFIGVVALVEDSGFCSCFDDGDLRHALFGWNSAGDQSLSVLGDSSEFADRRLPTKGVRLCESGKYKNQENELSVYGFAKK